MKYNPIHFNYDMMISEILSAWKGWAKKTHTTKVVIGISGGKDSSVVAALAKKLFGKENVLGVLMPNGEQVDIEDSYALVKHLDIPYVEINISTAVQGIYNEIKRINNGVVSKQTMINLPARVRMTTLYAVAQTYGGKVINTCNKSENYIGYSTLFGDDCGAFSPLKEVYATQVQQLGLKLGLPSRLALKHPSDGLCGKTDEDNLGFSYLELDTFLYENSDVNISLLSAIKIQELHDKNAFKEQLIQLPCPSIKENTPFHYYPNEAHYCSNKTSED